MDITIHLDESEAKIYGFLEKHANKAFTTFEIYLNVCVEREFREEIRKNCEPDDYDNHPLYQSLQAKLEKMVKE